MQTWDTITSRRNVRSFADRPIPAADLDRILEADRPLTPIRNPLRRPFSEVVHRGRWSSAFRE